MLIIYKKIKNINLLIALHKNKTLDNLGLEKYNLQNLIWSRDQLFNHALCIKALQNDFVLNILNIFLFVKNI